MCYPDFKYFCFDIGIVLLNAQQHNNVTTNTNTKSCSCHEQFIYNILF